MIGENQCEHGSLARKCLVCELTAEVEQLQERIDEMLADYNIRHALTPDYRAVWWSIDDMRSMDEDDPDWCCDECARGLLNTVMKHAEASIGISWEVIDTHRSMMSKDCDDDTCCFFKGVSE